MSGKGKPPQRNEGTGHVQRQGPAARHGGNAPKGTLRAVSDWFVAKRPVAGFVILFAVLLGGFYALTFIPAMEKSVLPGYMRWNAKASAFVLNLFGEGATADDTTVASRRFSVNIAHGCDAIEPSALFIAAVLAFPAPLKSKLPGVLIGTVVLAIINLVRIVTLFYTGIHWPKWFDAMHVDVWQPIFIVLSLVFWIVWAWWATRGKAIQPHASPPET